MLYNLLDLARQESEPNRYAHSEEYNKLFNELDNKTLIVDTLEKRMGCSLDVLQEVKKNEQIYIDTDIVQRPSGCEMTIRKGMYAVKGIDIFDNHILCLAEFSDCYMMFNVPTYRYKIDWFLKEDKSK
jgi:hypothetical protein